MGKSVLFEGPDISYHNGNVDIKKVRNAGCKRIGIRAGYGRNNVDQKFVQNALACFNLGVDVLLYWFSYAYTEGMAAQEGRYAVLQAKKYWTKCPIAYDFEYDSVNYARKNGINVTKKLATDMAISFLKIVKSSGYVPVLYTNKDYLNTYFDINRIRAEVGECYVWYARYTSKLSDSELNVVDVWQYSSTGKLDGILGNVDMNKFYTAFGGSCVKAVRKEKCNLNVLNFQKAANADCYNIPEDGLVNTETQSAINNIVMNVGSEGELVKWWQTRCNEILGLTKKVDGIFGSGTRESTILLQRKFSLSPDGVVGKNSIQAVFYN